VVRITRARVGIAAAVVGAVSLIVVPSLIARAYSDGPGGADTDLVRPEQGWEFLYHAVRESRGAEQGSESGALELARRIWRGPGPVALDVELTYFDGPFAVPVPPGGARPAPSRAMARPTSRFGWIVTGPVVQRRGVIGPRQMIGVIDMGSGRVTWNIEPLPRRAG
jgi:hypothetical protein